MDFETKQNIIENSFSKSIYLCDECGWKGPYLDMKNESDIDYNQDCCPKCNNVMFDNKHRKVYCKTIDEVRDDKINEILT